MSKVKNMKMFEAYGYQFPTWSSACRYKAFVRILDKVSMDPDARVRLTKRFLEIHEGRLIEKRAA